MSSVGDFCRCAVLLQIPSLHSKKYAELVNSLFFFSIKVIRPSIVSSNWKDLAQLSALVKPNQTKCKLFN